MTVADQCDVLIYEPKHTEIRAPRFIENVDIFDSAIEKTIHFFPFRALQISEQFRAVPSDGRSGILWKEISNSWLHAEAAQRSVTRRLVGKCEVSGKRLSDGHELPIPEYMDIFCRGQAKVIDSELHLGGIYHWRSCCADRDIRAQLSPLGIAADTDLFFRIAENAERYYRISSNKEQRQRAHRVVPIAEIFACFLAAGLFLFFGLPERSAQGFALTLAGLLCFMFGFGLLLHFAEYTVGAENDVSAPRYRGAENIRIVPIVIPELKLRDSHRVEMMKVDKVDLPEAAALRNVRS